MTYSTLENLGFIDRTTRITIGLIMSISILLTPFGSIWIAAVALAATYPLLTGLTAIDPIFVLYEIVKVEIKHLKKAMSTAAA